MTVKTFKIPDELNASIPAEYRHGSRDQVKMMVTESKQTIFTAFNRLADFVNAGDVMIFNNTRTIPAKLTAFHKNSLIEIRLSQQIDEFIWEGIILTETVKMGDKIKISPEFSLTVVGYGSESPLMRLRSNLTSVDTQIQLINIGSPVRYEYIKDPIPISAYQTVYGSVPGSMEMPSAGRAFTWRMINELKQKGVQLGSIQLFTGLSYYGEDRWPNPSNHPEKFSVSKDVANMVNHARKQGRRVIAVGTTVVRALESAAIDGSVVPIDQEYTDLYVDASYQRQIVDSLLSGLHEPEASHLDMLSNWIPRDELIKLYEEAIERNYLWHEFGDLHLIL